MNDDLSLRFDETMTWLKNKKSMRHLSPQAYWSLFAELSRHDITIPAKFKEYYEWLEKQTWVDGPIGVALLKSDKSIESYLNRDTLKKKESKNGKQSRGSEMSDYLRELNQSTEEVHR